MRHVPANVTCGDDCPICAERFKGHYAGAEMRGGWLVLHPSDGGEQWRNLDSGLIVDLKPRQHVLDDDGRYLWLDPANTDQVQRVDAQG